MRNQAPVDHRHRLEALGGERQIVGRRDDGSPAPCLILEDGHQVFLGGRVDAGDGLVEEVEEGSAASARARKMRRRWPPDSRPIWVLRWSTMPTWASASSTAGGRSRPAVGQGPSSG